VKPCPIVVALSAVIWCAVAAAQAPNTADQSAKVVQDFTKRVADYVKLRNNVRSDIHRLKPTGSAEALNKYQRQFASGVEEKRRGATQGAIFTPEIATEFRHRIAAAMQGPDAAAIRASLARGAPVQINRLRVNQPYPAGAPLQSAPPSLLLNLPQLPPEVEYRVVGHYLILRDVDANLIVDCIPDAIS
jgi:hypothetical protein